jgi:aryl-alcohol dehydrogenase-like predicted oxidoreductase
MEHRILGRAGVSVSKLCLGAMMSAPGLSPSPG